MKKSSLLFLVLGLGLIHCSSPAKRNSEDYKKVQEEETAFRSDFCIEEEDAHLAAMDFQTRLEQALEVLVLATQEPEPEITRKLAFEPKIVPKEETEMDWGEMSDWARDSLSWIQHLQDRLEYFPRLREDRLRLGKLANEFVLFYSFAQKQQPKRLLTSAQRLQEEWKTVRASVCKPSIVNSNLNKETSH